MPTFADARSVDAAIVALLAADPILAALMPGGVHWDIAPPHVTQFVTVTLNDFVSDLVFTDADGTERTDYLVKAIARTTVADPVLDAAARIHDLLHRQPLPLVDTGYELMIMRRVRRVRYSEFVGSQEWQHVGGVYQVMVTCGTPAAS